MNLYDFATIRDFILYYDMILCLGDEQRYMGTVNHLQVLELPEDLTGEGVSHVVRCYDGQNHRELAGLAYLETGEISEEDPVLILDMGGGKSYRFKKFRR